MNSFYPSLLLLHCYTAHVFLLKKGGGSASEEPLAKLFGVKQDRDNEREGDPTWEGSGMFVCERGILFVFLPDKSI